MNRDALLRSAQRFGTPLYVYDRAEVRARAAEMLVALSGHGRLLYSLKANPLLPLVSTIRDAGCGAEVSSLGELDVAVAAGFDPATVLYTGPGKSDAEIHTAIGLGATCFSAESAVELARLGRAAVAHERTVRVLLRLQPAEHPAAGLSMADGRQFGFEPAEAVRALRSAVAGVAVAGFHVYLGSQLGSVEDLLVGFADAKKVVEQVADATGVVPEVVDLGGGFPWPYAARGTGCALDGLHEGLEHLLGDWATAGGPEVWFETGRRLTASSGHLLTTIIDRKDRAGGSILVLDAGVNVLGGMAGLSRVLRPRAALDNLSVSGPPEPVTADVVGPLCTPLDRITVRTEIDRPSVGDVLRVPNAGAYGLTASLVAFLGRPAPLEVVVDDGTLMGSWRLSARAEEVAPPPGPLS